MLYEDERRLHRKNTNKDSLNSESSSDSEEREGPSSHQGKNSRLRKRKNTNLIRIDSDVPIRPFNPDAQIFRPIPDNSDTISLLSNSINSLISLSPTQSNNINLNSSSGSSSSGLGASTNLSSWTSTEPVLTPTSTSPITATNTNPPFINKPITTPVFSPQTFAQTKFGSLKSKHAGRRNQSKYEKLTTLSSSFSFFVYRMLPSEFSAYIKQKEQSRVFPLPFIDNPSPPIISPPSSAVIRPPNYRNHYNPYSTHSQLNSSSFNNNNTLPLTNGQSSIYVEQQMTSSTS